MLEIYYQKNKINENKENYNKAKSIGKEIKELLLYLNKTNEYKHLKTGKLLSKVKHKSTKKKIGSKLKLKKYENKNFAEYFSSKNITNILNKISLNNNNDLMEQYKKLGNLYLFIVNSNKFLIVE